MAEHDRLARTPVLVKDLNAVLGGNSWHTGSFDNSTNIRRSSEFPQRLMKVRAAGIQTLTTTDWRPNVGTTPSSDRTAPGRTSRFSAPDRSLRGNAWCPGSLRESQARR